MPLVFDSFKAVVRLSNKGRNLKIHCFKPEVDINSAIKTEGADTQTGPDSSSFGFKKLLNMFQTSSKSESRLNTADYMDTKRSDRDEISQKSRSCSNSSGSS